MKKLLLQILGRFASVMLNANHISRRVGLEIDPTVKLSQANLSGNIKIAEGCKIINGVKIVSNSKVSIGRYTSLNGPNMDIHAHVNQVKIGSFCSIARGVTIQEYYHHMDHLTTYNIHKNIYEESVDKDIFSKGNIVINNDVWIGANATILSGVRIGNGVIIAANSLVNKDIPDFAIVAGNPVKIIKMRFDIDLIKKINEIKWWDWSLEKIVNNKALFEGKLALSKFNDLK